MPDEIVIEVVVLKAGQPPDAAMVYFTEYVFTALVFGVIAPVEGSIVNPAGVAEYVPPAVPVRVTF